MLQAERTRNVRSSQIGILTAVLLLGAMLRISSLTGFRLHPDEALFATLGRLIISGHDPWLSQTALLVDKPPLFYYIIAAGISVSWASEMAARIPALFASIVSIALTGRVASSLWHGEVAPIMSALILALSPFGIAFSSTVFADPLITMWLLAALVALDRRRWGLAGFLYGLALATKQSAIFFAPLILGFGIVRNLRKQTSPTEVLRWAGKFVMGMGPIVAAVFLWDANRHAPVGFWNAGVEFNNPHRLIRSSEFLPRLSEWWFNARYLIGIPAATSAFLLALVRQAVLDTRFSRVSDRESMSGLVLSTYVVGYLAMFWIIAFPVFDRYLLPILPILALLTGRMIGKIMDVSTKRLRERYINLRALTVILFFVLCVSTIIGASGAIAVGGDHGTYDGIDEIAAYLHNQPSGTVVYYDSLGWSLQYYLFDSQIYLAPFASPAALEADLRQFGRGGEQRYLLLPGWQSKTEILDAIMRAGYSPVRSHETRDRTGQTSFSLYRIFRAP